MTAVILVLSYAFLHSFWWLLLTFMLKMKPIGESGVTFPNNILRAASGIGSSLLIAWSLANNGGIGYLRSLPIELWGWMAAALPFEIGAVYFFTKSAQDAAPALKAAVPIMAPVVAVGVAFMLGVDNWPSGLVLVGIAVLLTGIYLANSADKSGWWGPLKKIWKDRNTWLWYVVGTAVCGGTTLTIFKKCVQLSDYALTPGIIQFFGWGVFYLLAAGVAGDYGKLRHFPLKRTVWGLIGVGLLFGIPNALSAAAMNYHYVGVVGALKRTEVLFMLMWVWLIPHLRQEDQERGGVFRWRLIGLAIAVLGVFLISLSRYSGF